jgi:hypothetical protein
MMERTQLLANVGDAVKHTRFIQEVIDHPHP